MLVVGGWWLVVGGFWLLVVVGGWLVVDGWWRSPPLLYPSRSRSTFHATTHLDVIAPTESDLEPHRRVEEARNDVVPTPRGEARRVQADHESEEHALTNVKKFDAGLVWGVGCGVWGVGCGVWGVGRGLWVVPPTYLGEPGHYSHVGEVHAREVHQPCDGVGGSPFRDRAYAILHHVDQVSVHLEGRVRRRRPAPEGLPNIGGVNRGSGGWDGMG